MREGIRGGTYEMKVSNIFVVMISYLFLFVNISFSGKDAFGCADRNGLSSRMLLYESCVFLSYVNVVLEAK